MPNNKNDVESLREKELELERKASTYRKLATFHWSEQEKALDDLAKALGEMASSLEKYLEAKEQL